MRDGCAFIGKHTNKKYMKKDEDSTTEVFMLIIIGIPLGILLSAYGAFAVVKFQEWFDMPFHLNNKQAYGLSAIISILFYSCTKRSETIKESVSHIISGFFVVTCLLVINYLVATIFF